MLVVNKIDRPDARIAEVVSEVEELFLDLDAEMDQLDSPSSMPVRARVVLLCSARKGSTTSTMTSRS